MPFILAFAFSSFWVIPGGEEMKVETKTNTEAFTNTGASASNIQMNLGSGSLTASNVNGTNVDGTRVTGGGIILRKGGSGGQTPVLEIPTGGSIKFGDTWLEEKHIRMLTGQTGIKIRNGQYGSHLLDSGGRSGDNDSRPKSIQSGGIAYMQSDYSDSNYRTWYLSPW